eukprot:30068-Pelagococcus_subviridis.AAC.6
MREVRRVRGELQAVLVRRERSSGAFTGVSEAHMEQRRVGHAERRVRALEEDLNGPRRPLDEETVRTAFVAGRFKRRGAVKPAGGGGEDLRPGLVLVKDGEVQCERPPVRRGPFRNDEDDPRVRRIKICECLVERSAKKAVFVHGIAVKIAASPRL